MKPYRHLYPAICAWENLEKAYRRARKGKRGRADDRRNGPPVGGWLKTVGT
jgi:hypothetical protein